MAIPPSRKQRVVAIDATITAIAVLDLTTSIAIARPSYGYQTHNELFALLFAFEIFGRHVTYLTDSAAVLSLCKHKNIALARLPVHC